ncbi:MAG: glycosyltransferase family 2 protein, partial [Paracoccus sp. (in: a-proteobacteria)]
DPGYEDDLVSIITPACKAQAIVGQTIGSVIAQTSLNGELLVADDLSPDNTAAVVAEAARSDSRVKLIQCEVNGGPAAARNAALDQAKGRWIAFLDSDDLWLPEKLTSTLAFAKVHKSALSFTGFRRMSMDSGVVGRFVPVPKKMTYRKLLGNTAIATSTVLIDRVIVDGLRMRPVFYDDFVCWLEILKRGHEAHGLNEDLMRYRVVPNSFSRNKRRSAVCRSRAPSPPPRRSQIFWATQEETTG